MMHGRKKAGSRENNIKERKIMKLIAAVFMGAVFIYGVFFAEKAGCRLLFNSSGKYA